MRHYCTSGYKSNRNENIIKTRIQ